MSKNVGTKGQPSYLFSSMGQYRHKSPFKCTTALKYFFLCSPGILTLPVMFCLAAPGCRCCHRKYTVLAWNPGVLKQTVKLLITLVMLLLRFAHTGVMCGATTTWLCSEVCRKRRTRQLSGWTHLSSFPCLCQPAEIFEKSQMKSCSNQKGSRTVPVVKIY